MLLVPSRSKSHSPCHCNFMPLMTKTTLGERTPSSGFHFGRVLIGQLWQLVRVDQVSVLVVEFVPLTWGAYPRAGDMTTWYSLTAYAVTAFFQVCFRIERRKRTRTHWPRMLAGGSESGPDRSVMSVTGFAECRNGLRERRLSRSGVPHRHGGHG
ncbi:hypothetical protein B0H63DRAFT_112656 [Podospora didyma]|uniref:Uncharacterized protein n=1 Tax=Podospora didyma TaxID=330526 RepID=A0AAE0NZ49_9PEZI|nr:hypothetical protein B0H63DRAFT_112656 [Podospora didyma]